MDRAVTAIIEEAAEFGIGRTPYEAGTPSKWFVTCKCGTTEYFGCPAETQPHATVAKIRKRGWRISERQSPVCKLCAIKERPVKQDHITWNTNPKIARKVYALLDDHFNEETKLYRSGWNDDKIAAEIQTSVEVVTRIREEAYGKLAEDPALQALRDDIELVRMETIELQTQFNTNVATMLDKLSDLEKRLVETTAKKAV